MADKNKQWFNEPEDRGNTAKRRPNGAQRRPAGKNVPRTAQQRKPSDRRPERTGVNADPKAGMKTPVKTAPKPGTSARPERSGINEEHIQYGKRPAKQYKVTKKGRKTRSEEPVKLTPEEAQRKQEAEIEKINRLIEEKEAAKQIKESPKKESAREAKKEAKEDKKSRKLERRKKESLNSHAKAERNAVRNGIFGAIAVSAALLVLAFVVYHLVSYVAEKPQSSFITDGAIEHTIGAKALVVREETTVKSGAEGELVTSVTEGSRVASAQHLAMVVPEDKKSTVDDLRNVQSQISDVQQELIDSGNVTAAKKVYDTYNESLDPIIDMIRSDSTTGKLQSLATYSSSLTVLLDERESALSEIDFNDERLRILRSDEAKYQNALQKSSAVVSASKPGIVSFRLDGQEDTLNFDQVLTAEKGEVRKIINSSVGSMSANYKVKKEDSVCRIVQNEKQLLAVYLNRKDAAATDFAVGTKHDINISAEGLVIENASVVRCESGDDGMLIVFETTRFVEDLLDLRTVDIEIVITRSSGLRVSKSSLLNEDLIDSSKSGFSVYFDAETGVGPESFTAGSIFNVNIMPNPIQGDDGAEQSLESVVIPGCEVMHCEQDEKGGVIVGFSTGSDFSRIMTVNTKFTAGYQAVFIDSNTGLGVNVGKIKATNYKGIASIYVNNQGFVAEHRVLVTDYDREFAVIIPISDNKVPDRDTVIIINPKSCKPDDKVV